MDSNNVAVQVEVDPSEVGFDPDRLGRVAEHLHGYVDRELLPGTYVLITRGGKVAYVDLYGWQDVERSIPVAPDTVYRFYSMTKPIASIALMQLYEQGRFLLRDPISRWIPAFAKTRVYTGGDRIDYETREASREITVHDLLTHMSGLSYDFHVGTAVSGIYRQRGFNWGAPTGLDLGEMCDLLADLPLVFDPGSEWNYSHSTDVVGRLVEVISGQSLDEYLAEHILGPLGMVDTAFWVAPDNVHRFAGNYTFTPGSMKRKLVDDAQRSPYLSRPKLLSGGGGLVSTMADYHRFTQMLRGGGTLDGRRIIGRATLDFMTLNHIPGGMDLSEYGRPLFSETAFEGVGFGLGFSVVTNPAKTQTVCSAGEYGWGGAASTAFWVDPAEDITVIFLTQLFPSSTHPIRPELKALVYQALT